VGLGVSDPVEALIQSAVASTDDLMLDQLKRHIARELHDQVAQPLIGIVLQLYNVRASLDDSNPLAGELARLEESTRNVLRQAREAMIDLRGRGDLRINLAHALNQDLVAPAGRNLSVRLSSRWPRRTNGWAAFNLLRIVQQVVANAWQHGRAKAVEVLLDVGPTGDAVIVILDDGLGTDGAPYGFGMVGMAEWATILGGSLTAGPRHDGGTRVEVRVPVDRLA